MYDVVAPVWYAMQIEQDGSLLIEMSHSEMGDIDFACYGPFEGSSKNVMLEKDCFNPDVSFWTSLSYKMYCEDFYDEFQWNGVYPENCTFAYENRQIYDSLLKYSNSLLEMKTNRLQCWYDFDAGYISEFDFLDCSSFYDKWINKLSDTLERLQLIDPRYYDTTSNCFRPNVDPFPDGKMVDCCFSLNSKEICRIDNAKHGEWYLMLLSNYSLKEGNISFKKVGGNASTNCDVIIDAYVNDPVCEGEDIRFMVNNAPSDATFLWTGPNGFSSTLCSPTISNASKEHEGTYSVQMRVGYKKSPIIGIDVKVNPICVVDTIIYIQHGDTLIFGGKRLVESGDYEHRFYFYKRL